MAWMGAASAASAERCKPSSWRGWRSALSVDGPDAAAADLYNGLLWAGATGGLIFGSQPTEKSRWREDNSFDTWMRSVFSIEGRPMFHYRS